MGQVGVRLLMALAAFALVGGVRAAEDPARVGLGDPEIERSVRPLIERAMQVGATPGLQVAVVTRDGRAWTGAFGVADAACGRPVTTDTRFYIASTTKALTALAGARLHERRELDLDSTLSETLHGARLPACARPERLTLRSLLTHSHGLRHQGIQWRMARTGEYSNELLLGMLGEATCTEAGTFRYSNLGYDLFGIVLDADRTGGWKSVVEREVIGPLGMGRTTAWRSALADADLAMPHEFAEGGTRRIPLMKGDENLGPAGGHFSTASDLGRLLIAELNGGRIGGVQAIEEGAIRATQAAWVEQDREFVVYRRHHWGLGWDIGTYDGETVLHRPGGFAGYYANAAFLPDHGFGVAVLTNGGAVSTRAAEAVASGIYDVMLNLPDPAGRLDERLRSLRAHLATISAQGPEETPDLATEPARVWETYVGRYRHPTWGTVTVVRSEDGLDIRMGVLEDALHPLRDGSDSFYTRLFGDAGVVEFEVAGHGPAFVLRFRGESERYHRVPG